MAFHFRNLLNFANNSALTLVATKTTEIQNKKQFTFWIHDKSHTNETNKWVCVTSRHVNGEHYDPRAIVNGTNDNKYVREMEMIKLLHSGQSFCFVLFFTLDIPIDIVHDLDDNVKSNFKNDEQQQTKHWNWETKQQWSSWYLITSGALITVTQNAICRLVHVDVSVGMQVHFTFFLCSSKRRYVLMAVGRTKTMNLKMQWVCDDKNRRIYEMSAVSTGVTTILISEFKNIDKWISFISHFVIMKFFFFSKLFESYTNRDAEGGAAHNHFHQSSRPITDRYCINANDRLSTFNRNRIARSLIQCELEWRKVFANIVFSLYFWIRWWSCSWISDGGRMNWDVDHFASIIRYATADNNHRNE